MTYEDFPQQPGELQQSPAEAIPTAFPEFPPDALAGLIARYHRFNQLVNNDTPPQTQHVWQVEQRLGAINDARETGAVDSATGDILELAALREFRRLCFWEGSPIDLNSLHLYADRLGLSRVNVQRYKKSETKVNPSFSNDGVDSL